MKTVTINPTILKEDDNFLCSLELPESLNVYLFYQGSDKVKYIVTLKDAILFEGNDYRPAPSFGVDSLESVIGLLTFLTLKKGDTDEDYFKDYTPAQFKWSESRECEELSSYAMDHEDADGEYYNVANDYFRQYFNI